MAVAAPRGWRWRRREGEGGGEGTRWVSYKSPVAQHRPPVFVSAPRPFRSIHPVFPERPAGEGGSPPPATFVSRNPAVGVRTSDTYSADGAYSHPRALARSQAHIWRQWPQRRNPSGARLTLARVRPFVSARRPREPTPLTLEG